MREHAMWSPHGRSRSLTNERAITERDRRYGDGKGVAR
jgi:hypothetical protein